MSDEHREDWDWRLKRFQRDFAERTLDTVTTRAIADWLDTFPVRSSNMHRTRLIQFFDWCVAKGLIEYRYMKVVQAKR